MIMDRIRRMGTTRMPTFGDVGRVCVRHVNFLGPGLVSAVAYIDPGNWATDLQAGANYGYKLLFIVLLAGLGAVILQTQALKLGIATSLSLPTQTRLLFQRLQVRYPRFRTPLKLSLWALYGLAEAAIIATDIAELVGSAIGLALLFPKLPIYAGVLITAADVLILLVFFSSDQGKKGMMMFEIVIVCLVLAVFVSFIILLHQIQPVWPRVFEGYIPSKTLIDPSALYLGVGIIGATVMPHALFLGSHLSTVDRLNMVPLAPQPKRSFRNFAMPSLNLFRRRRSAIEPAEQIELAQNSVTTELEIQRIQSGDSKRFPIQSEGFMTDVVPDLASEMDLDEEAKEMVKRQRNFEEDMKRFDRIRWADIHLKHATVDTVMSLLGFAVTINSAILILAGAAFFYSPDPVVRASGKEADLFGAHALVKQYVGTAASFLFALALLCAGQSASITCTLAGQVVSEGFIEWKTSPFVRRLCTRLIGVIPSAIVTASIGKPGLNTMLVATQVLLSLVLPSVIFPLVWLCSKDHIMTVKGPEVDGDGNAIPEGERESKSFRSSRVLTVLGFMIFGVVVIANGYVIVQLGLGN